MTAINKYFGKLNKATTVILLIVYLIVFQTTCSLREKSIDEQYQKALTWLEKGKPEKSIDEIKKLIPKDSTNAFLYYHLGTIYMEYLNEFDSAMHYYHKAIGFNPKLGAAWHNLGLAKFRRIQYGNINENLKSEHSIEDYEDFDDFIADISRTIAEEVVSQIVAFYTGIDEMENILNYFIKGMNLDLAFNSKKNATSNIEKLILNKALPFYDLIVNQSVELDQDVELDPEVLLRLVLLSFNALEIREISDIGWLMHLRDSHIIMENPFLLYQAGLYALKSSFLLDAYEYFELLGRSDDNVYRILATYGKGKLELKQGEDYNRAYVDSCFTEFLSNNFADNHPCELFRISEYYGAIKQYDKALKTGLRAYKVDSSIDLSQEFNLGNFSYWTDNIDDAIYFYNLDRKYVGDMEVTDYMLMLAYSKLSDLDSTLVFAKKLNDLDQTSLNNLIGIAGLYCLELQNQSKHSETEKIVAMINFLIFTDTYQRELANRSRTIIGNDWNKIVSLVFD